MDYTYSAWAIKRMSGKDLKALFAIAKKSPIKIALYSHTVVTIKHDPNATNLYAGAFETDTERYEYDTKKSAFTTFTRLLANITA